MSAGLRPTLKRLDRLLKRKPKQAFDLWMKYVQAVNNKEFVDGIKSRELKAKLEKVARRILRDETERILGDGSKVKGAIRKIYSTILLMPHIAMEKWKKYLEGLKSKSFFDNIRSLKVKGCMEGIVKRKMRDASQRVLGGDNKIKGCLQTLVN